MLDVVEQVASQVFIPFTVGGGIRTIEAIRETLLAGADKVSLNSPAVREPQLIARAADRFGSQCVVVAGADCPKDVGRLKEALGKVDDSILFLESSIGPVIGSHVGPGMIAVVFWGGDKREDMSVADRIARKVKQG